MERLAGVEQKYQVWAEKGFRFGFLTDEQLGNRSFLGKLNSLWHVAVHEVGHKIVGGMYGLGVSFISIIPDGNTLGFTKFVRNPGQTIEQWYMNFGRASFGGEAAESLLGNNDHSGSGSDRGHARFTARILDFLNPEGIVSVQRSDAYGAIASVGRTRIEEEAWYLTSKKAA